MNWNQNYQEFLTLQKKQTVLEFSKYFSLFFFKIFFFHFPTFFLFKVILKNIFNIKK